MTEREALTQSEQHQNWCASLTQMLASMPPKPAPCNCKPEPVIDKSAALRIATSLGWEPKREFVGLTDEEIDALLKSGDVAEHDAWNGRWYVLPYSLTRAIEAKLRSKNT